MASNAMCAAYGGIACNLYNCLGVCTAAITPSESCTYKACYDSTLQQQCTSTRTTLVSLLVCQLLTQPTRVATSQQMLPVLAYKLHTDTQRA